MRAALRALKDHQILAVAPEGTRSTNGQLGRGKPGIVTLALRSRAPILPLVYYGHEDYMDNVRKLRRTEFNVRVGEPFRLKPSGEKLNGEIRQHMADEIMFQLAALLPLEYRGFYRNLSPASQEFLEFI
jgi:1-acyl-sn-glycerol-3-phosphate acyltransferase